ncbi:hypothetical protein SETIT_2G377600v2 [Setaria italica]|uniref:Uncharacterized protein n=1 Tax=Setaria italica TaxID=4555 RepID=A0A368Q761_SETIT|nr:hypothetical protein SETIT_2G377600v2 [Setaria italica]
MDMWRSFGCALTLQGSSGYIRILSLQSGSPARVSKMVFFGYPCRIVACQLGVAGETTEPGDCEDCSAHSTEKQYASSVLLMDFEDLFVDWVPAMSFILGSSSLREMEKARLAAMAVVSDEDRWVLLF